MNLFGCSHRRTTFPQAPRGLGHMPGATHVTCLDCGKEFVYDWKLMKRGAEIRRETAKPELPAGATTEAA